ncbi:NADH-ubiquinone oxidoreductase-F iron-sulfur binding region domain-containing protein [Streptomyces capparidis]
MSYLPEVVTIGPPRLLAGLDGVDRLDRVAHLVTHGQLPELRQNEVVDLAENIDLRGRGGAGFPFARKLQAVIKSAAGRGGRCVVVVNGSEGEPACRKDKALLLRAPHLVWDGAMLAARALGAEQVVIGVTRTDVERSMLDALSERGPAGVATRVAMLPERFVTGESSAQVNGINGGPTVPNGRKIRTSDYGVDGLPTLFSNTETFAQMAVAARLTALPFRATGLPTEPGTVLLTVAGRYVVETPTGVPLSYVLQLCGMDLGQGVLVGGYHGGFLDRNAAYSALISRESMKAHGATLGAGAVCPIPEDTCPLGETARVAHWMAKESAGQCGPCAFGLPALAKAVDEMLAGGGRMSLEQVNNWINSVSRRGACSHPDGTAGFIASALRTFTDDLAAHVLGNGCGRPVKGVFPLTVEGSEPAAAQAVPTDRLLVDWTLCEGHGLCADVLPDVVRLGPDGYPDSADFALPVNLRPQARRAIRRCPALALRLESDG